MKNDLTLHERRQRLIEKFVKPEKINWPRAFRELKSLESKHTLEVLEFVVLGFMLNTLTFFNRPDGLKEIAKAKKLMDQLAVKPTEKVELNSSSYQRKTDKKQTILDFIK